MTIFHCIRCHVWLPEGIKSFDIIYCTIDVPWAMYRRCLSVLNWTAYHVSCLLPSFLRVNQLFLLFSIVVSSSNNYYCIYIYNIYIYIYRYIYIYTYDLSLFVHYETILRMLIMIDQPVQQISTNVQYNPPVLTRLNNHLWSTTMYNQALYSCLITNHQCLNIEVAVCNGQKVISFYS